MLTRLFGKKPFAALHAEANRLFERDEYGPAKLAYEKAADAKDAPAEIQATLQERIAACCDAIGRQRMGEALRLKAQGAVALAEDELRHALETARDAALQATIEEHLNECSQPTTSPPHPSGEQTLDLDDDTLFLTLSGHWEEAQATEYERYGERFRQALLRFHDGHYAVAAREFEALLADVPEAEYLWFEVGRARLKNGDPQGAIEAFSTFIRHLGPSEGGDTRLAAHMTLAGIAASREDIEGALDCYGDAIDALPDDPRPYLAMGAFMRTQGLAEEAVDVLQSGLAVLGEDRPHYELWQELGLAFADLSGHEQEAKTWLEKVIAFFTARRVFDLPPASALRLAELHEQAGNPGRAADLLKLLTQGSDQGNQAHYHLEACRVLLQLGSSAEAERMALRAEKLTQSADDATKAKLSDLRAQMRAATGTGR